MMSSAEVAQVVVEFYTTSNEVKRVELHDWLLQAQKGPNAWQIALDLLQTDKPHSVQYFAANCLYDTVTKRWEECLSSAEMVENLKGFLLKRLTSNAHVQSITNKLSSTLALVALHCIPDVWPNPVADLTTIWASQPELLLRVLAEFPTEFVRVRMPLPQRGVLKSELHAAAKSIIVIVGAVLSQEDSPSIRNAAVDCVEQWLKLPGVSLDDWRPLVVAVLSSVRSDSSALARLLTVLSVHDDLLQLEQLVMDLLEFMATDVRADLEPQLGDGEEDATALVVAVVQLAERAARPLLIATAKGNARAAGNLRSLCELLVKVSTIQGRYPTDELISDIPCTFWTTVREEVLSLQDSRLSEEEAQKVRDLMKPHYAVLLQSAMDKLAYAPDTVLAQWDLEAKESFERYRKTMSDTAVNAYLLLGGETVQFVLQTLASAAQDSNKAEATLFVWEQMADFLTGADEPAIVSLLSNAQALSLGGDRLANTLLRLICSLAHLIVTGDCVGTTYPQAIRVVLSLIDRTATTHEALITLNRLAEERIPELEPVANELIDKCYRFFTDEAKDATERLSALKCLGLGLSLRPPSVVLDSLNSLLAPRLGRLQECVSSGSTQSMSDEDVLFELSVVSTLTGSLQRPVKEGDEVPQGASPVFLVLEQSFPLFEVLLAATEHNVHVVQRICDALNSGLCSLLDGASRLVPGYCRLLSAMIVDGPSAFTVAKTLFLVFAQDQAAVLGDNWTHWAERIARMATENIDSDVFEPFLAFAYQLMKKNWNFCIGDSAIRALPHVLDAATAVMAGSLEAPAVKQAAMLLAALVAKASEAPCLVALLSARGQKLISVAYSRLQTEILTSSVEFAADILFVFASDYPMETRQCLAAALEQSPLVGSMLSEVRNKRKFREFAKRINLAARRS